MEEAILISICIPAFRRTEFLKRLLDSIAIQTYQNYEVVITDDSPDDGVGELVEQHSVKPRIRYVKNAKTLGSPENWNEGLRMAKSDWIKIMHDDDWFSGPESLGYYAEAIRKGIYQFYFSAYTNTYPDGRGIPVHISEQQLEALRLEPEMLLAVNRVGPPSAVIFKKDLTVLFDQRMQWLVDIDFYIRYLNRYPPAIYIPKNLVHIGISESQVTRSSFGNRKIEIPERFLLLEKIRPESLKNVQVYDSWWRFIRNMKIRDAKDISDNGYQGKIPETILSMIHFQKNIPSPVLRNGFFSKLLMGAHYLFESLGSK